MTSETRHPHGRSCIVTPFEPGGIGTVAHRTNRGLLVPPWYVGSPPATPLENNVASVLFGASLGCAAYTLAKGARQTAAARRRQRLRSIYLFFVWTTWFASLGISCVNLLFVYNIMPPRYVIRNTPSAKRVRATLNVPPSGAWLVIQSRRLTQFVSFWTFFAYGILWQLQVGCILQIIANRVAFLISGPAIARTLKLSIFALTTILTFVGAGTWIPLMLQLTPFLAEFNHKWDLSTKGVFGVVDLGLNSLFLTLVWKKFISEGLEKYWTLFRFHCFLSVVSILLDLVCIGLELTTPVNIWICFNPVVFLGKLYVELCMAEMLGRVVRTTNILNTVSTTPSTQSRGLDYNDVQEITMIAPEFSTGSY